MSARDVWERLEREGWTEVERWLEEREPEGLHLDFKEKGREATFDENDLGRVAKALSAFANVEGGVLVIGVRAEGATRTDPDRVVAIPGVADADKALGVLERRLPSLTDPPVPGARAVAWPSESPVRMRKHRSTCMGCAARCRCTRLTPCASHPSRNLKPSSGSSSQRASTQRAWSPCAATPGFN